MPLVPGAIPANFATATEMSQFFITRNHGDVDAAAKDMEAVLRRNRRLYNVMVDELVRIAVEERVQEYVAGLGQQGRGGEHPTGFPGEYATFRTVGQSASLLCDRHSH